VSADGSDIAAALAAEVAGLKDRSKRRFRAHDTGIKGTFFVVFPHVRQDKAEVEGEEAAEALPGGLVLCCEVT
jgi:hypothetical protein